MCGIAGYAGGREIPSDRIERCLGLMHRRGPDDADWRRFVDRGRSTYLLHTRLRIIDLDPRANQPFQLGSRWMAYNGELYNYLERRAELERLGFVPRTTSDTEVVLRDLEQHGPEAAEGWEGMWALAVYDESDGSLLLSRDRFGEKPLWILAEGDEIWFGSEVKFIAALRGRPLAPDLDQVRRYLVNGYKALYKREPSFWRGVTELPAASSLTIGRDGRRTSHRYWAPRFAPQESMTRDEAVAATRERLLRAVELRLRADVPLAFCMSGGVDSNALIAIAKRVFGYRVHGFTIASSDVRYEESDLVAAAVRELAIEHTSIATDTADFLPRLRALVRQHDAPVYTITYYAHALLMASIAADGYRVAVSGTGADELFTGYYDHHLAYLREVRGDAALHARSLAAWRAHVRPHVRNPWLGDPDLFVRDPGFRGHIYLDADELAQALVAPWSEPFDEQDYASDLLRSRMLNELRHESVPVILHEDDLNAMFYSIENRSPFLDRPLCELAYSIPTRHLVRDGFAKSVLRDAVRGLAPDAVLDARRKVGFNASILEFLDAGAPAVRAELLAPSPIFELVRRERIEALLGRDSLPNSQSKFLFNFICAKMFLEEAAA